MKYRTAYEIADTAISELSRLGWQHKHGAAREAALAAVPFDGPKDIRDVIVKTLRACRVNLWDGSIA